MSNKLRRAVEAVSVVMKVAIKGVLADSIGEHYSEADWDGITAAIIDRASEYLRDDFDFNAVLDEGDIADRRGTVNAAGLIAALEVMASHATRKGAAPALRHLAANVKHVFGSLGHLKEPMKEAADGQEA